MKNSKAVGADFAKKEFLKNQVITPRKKSAKKSAKK